MSGFVYNNSLNQQKNILVFFRENLDKEFTPYEVESALFPILPDKKWFSACSQLKALFKKGLIERKRSTFYPTRYVYFLSKNKELGLSSTSGEDSGKKGV